MPSPFPGMDPWLEDEELFPDLHEKLTVYLCESLNAAMPARYVAVTRTRVWVDDDRRREPDVSVLGRDRPAAGGGFLDTFPGLVAVGEATEPEPWEEPYLEIVTAKGRRLVTAVEVVSPANKRAGDKGRATYEDKQKEFRLGGVHLVEIDLLRAGQHVTAVPLKRLTRKAGAFDYHVSVTVAGSPGRYFAAPIRLADRLPTIGVPLDPDVPAVGVDLQPLVDRAYDTGRYAALIRYDRPPDPPLADEQQAWVDGVLREKGLIA